MGNIERIPLFDAHLFIHQDLPYSFRSDYNIKFEPEFQIHHPDPVQRYKGLLKVIIVIKTTELQATKLRMHNSDHVDWQLVEVSHCGGAVQSNIDGFDSLDIKLQLIVKILCTFQNSEIIPLGLLTF